ncbi:ATP-binding cassette domain-containing protein [bacterium]|nr:MAG: ATP-binding cassette domain-containing protein [bacterium]
MMLYRARNLTFSYDGIGVLNIPQLDLPEGQFTALTGPNGSGKSTLLMILGFILRPSGGSLLFRGRETDGEGTISLQEIRRQLGILLQAPYLFRTTVERNVAYSLRVRGIPRHEIPSRVSRAMHTVGLAGYEKRHHHALSGGEAQRVALARSIAAEPSVLLLDEPLTNVDSASRSIIERVLMEKNRDEGVAVIITTHDLDQAYRLADEVVTLVDGTLSPGAMENVFNGAVYQSGGGWVFDTGRIRIAVPRDKDGSRTASIPPETVLLSREPVFTSALNTFKGKVTSIQQRNGSVDVSVDIGEILTSRITDGSYRSLGISLGDNVNVIFKAEAVRLY